MRIEIKPFFETEDGRVASLYVLENDSGIRAEISDFGGAIIRLFVPDRAGSSADVMMACPSPEDYMRNAARYMYQGVLVGRNSNRISDAVCYIDGEKYSLEANLPPHNLHGGTKGLSLRLMKGETAVTDNGPCLILTHQMKHLSDDFPGNLDITVKYTVCSDNTFLIDYEAVSDATTIINLTNHAYFNLAGHASGSIRNQELQLESPFYMPSDELALCTGEICRVDGTPFDFRKGKSFDEALSAEHPHTKIFGGFDHNFALPGQGYRLAGKASHPASGRTMECYTTSPCVHLFTYNIAEPLPGKDGAIYNKHQGFCLETQTVPNAPNMPWFQQPIYKAGEYYKESTGYRFGVA
jgi:aldose 1-epimerase